jgi:hypothetical protein
MLPAVAPVIVAGIVVFGLVGLANFAIRRRLEGQGHRPLLAPPAAVPEHSFDEGRSVSFRGGSRVGQANATAPLIRVRADEGWIHITGSLRLFGGAAACVDRARCGRSRRPGLGLAQLRDQIRG